MTARIAGPPTSRSPSFGTSSATGYATCSDIARSPTSDIARCAAELVERAPDPERFWAAHSELMTRSDTLTEDDLRAVASELGLARQDAEETEDAARRAGRASTPT